MTRPHYLSALVLLLVGGGSFALPTLLGQLDGGPVGAVPGLSDAGVPPSSPSHTDLDGGTVAPQPFPEVEESRPLPAVPGKAQSIKWPDDLQPLATLDGPAILAANAALQRVLGHFPEKYKQSCAYSAKAMEVIVGQQGGIYFVRINQRLDKCGRASPRLSAGFDWFELYAVSPDGEILERYPYHP